MERTPIRVSDLAKRLGDRVYEGGPEALVNGLAEISNAGVADLCFIRSRADWEKAGTPVVGGLIAPPDVSVGSIPVIRSSNPSLDFGRAARWFSIRTPRSLGIHPDAVVAKSAEVAPGVAIGAGSVVSAKCRIGAGSILHSNVTLYEGSSVGDGTVIHAGVVLCEGVTVGDRVILHPGVVIGGDGFGYEFNESGLLEKIPQLGSVEVGDDVEIGANTTVDRARVGVTRIGSRTKIDNLVQIGHNCDIGEDSVIVAQAGLGGSTRLGRGVAMMGQTASAGQLSIGDGAILGGRAAVDRDVKPGVRMFGSPAVEGRNWHRSVALIKRLPEFFRRLRALETHAVIDGKDRDA